MSEHQKAMTDPVARPDVAELTYQVWVEKCAAGWVTVRAPNEEVARRRAKDVAERDRWSPTDEDVRTCEVIRV